MTRAALRSPVSGEPLAADTPHSLVDADGRRWPVIDEIPYLRSGRERLAEEAVSLLDRGDRDGALVRLLGDQDDWWTGPRPSPEDLGRLVRERDSLSLRDAMALLSFGRVADYFAHRWSDPTFLAGLGLIEAHWRPAASAFELACGIGHFGREFVRRGVAYCGADVVFAKLWLARWWVVGSTARLVCFDAAHPWPVADERFDVVLCQDAFYFLEPKRFVRDRLLGLVSQDGWLAIGHIHNREATNFSAGAAVAADELAALFPDGIFYDDAELTDAVVEARAPAPAEPRGLRAVDAFALASGPGLDPTPRPLVGGFAMPPAGHGPLRPNPLYRQTPSNSQGARREPSAFVESGLSPEAREEEAWDVVWPSERYREEYQRLATYPSRFSWPASPDGLGEAIRRRALVDLPERW